MPKTVYLNHNYKHVKAINDPQKQIRYGTTVDTESLSSNGMN